MVLGLPLGLVPESTHQVKRPCRQTSCNSMPVDSDSESRPKRLIRGNVDGKRRKHRTANTWSQDLKVWTTLGMTAASQFAVDRNIGLCHEEIKVTAAQVAHLTREMTVQKTLDDSKQTLRTEVGCYR